MKAWLVEKTEGAARSAWREVADLVPGASGLLLKVRARGIDRTDLMLNTGHYARIPTKPRRPPAGLEGAGEVMGMPAGAHAEQMVRRICRACCGRTGGKQ